MFETIAILLAIGLLLLIGLGTMVLIKKLFGHYFSASDIEHSNNNCLSNQGVGASLPSMKRKLPTILKGIGVGVLAIVSISALDLLEGVTKERGRLYSNVTYEVGTTWGKSQMISGPVLVIPFTYDVFENKIYKTSDGEEKIKQVLRVVADKMVILPEQLNININLDYDFRYRGIYQAMVYNAKITGSANFLKAAITDKSIKHVNYHDSYLSFGVSDNKAIQRVTDFSIDNKPQKLNSGTNLGNLGLSSGFHAPISITKNSENITINFAIDFRGSKSISVLPLAEDTLLKVSSNWQHPSFHGMLPNSRKVTDKGFSAQWELSHLSRNYPQVFRASQDITLQEVTAKTILFEPVTHYSKVKRSVKYGILFICLTFLALFVFDLKKQVNFSLIQYGLVGVSLSLFYLLLLSLSEHISFLASYLVAVLIATISIASYVGVAAKSMRSALLMSGLLLTLYSVLYSILQLEQFALLTGTLFLILIMLTLMYATRHLAKPKLQNANEGLSQ